MEGLINYDVCLISTSEMGSTIMEITDYIDLWYMWAIVKSG